MSNSTQGDASQASPDECLTLEVPQAGALIGLSRNAAYAAAKRGDIPTIRFGKLLKVPKARFLRMINSDQ